MSNQEIENIQPWRNDDLMRDKWPEWKSLKNKKIVFDPKETPFASEAFSKPSVAFMNARVALGDTSQWEYVGDKVEEDDKVIHYFRHLEHRTLNPIPAPIFYRVPKTQILQRRK